MRQFDKHLLDTADRSILVTGGTGSFVNAFFAAAVGSRLRKLIIYSRDEMKQYEMAKRFPQERYPFGREPAPAPAPPRSIGAT